MCSSKDAYNCFVVKYTLNITFLFTRRSLFLPLDFSSPQPLYDLVPSPPAVSAAVAKAAEPITPEIPAKGRKQSLPKHTLFTIIPCPYLLFRHVILRVLLVVVKDLRVIYWIKKMSKAMEVLVLMT